MQYTSYINCLVPVHAESCQQQFNVQLYIKYHAVQYTSKCILQYHTTRGLSCLPRLRGLKYISSQYGWCFWDYLESESSAVKKPPHRFWTNPASHVLCDVSSDVTHSPSTQLLWPWVWTTFQKLVLLTVILKYEKCRCRFSFMTAVSCAAFLWLLRMPALLNWFLQIVWHLATSVVAFSCRLSHQKHDLGNKLLPLAACHIHDRLKR